MDVREVAKCLANADGNGFGDVKFAETFVLMYKIWKTNNVNYELTREDMNNFEIGEFKEWLTGCIAEILFSEEIDPSAWWKQKGE